MPPSTSKPATLSDVARMAGVSRWVAGHVINGGFGNSRVSRATAERILCAARQLNYHPNHAARTLRGKRSHTFGLLVASAGDPLRSFLVQYLDAEAVKIGCRTLISNTIGNKEVGPDQFGACVEDLARRRVDGIFCAVHHWFQGDRAGLLARHPNTVFYEDPGVQGAVFLSVDRAEAARLAVRHLIGRGRQRIGLAVMSLSQPTHQDRRRGYLAELQAQGRPIDQRLVFDGEAFGLAYAHYNMAQRTWDFPVEIIDRAIDALVRDQHADAIVAHDDFWAAALLRRLRARGITVPDDVAVVGYLNHYLADWTDPALTTVDLEHETAARWMVQLLEEMITNGPLPPNRRAVKINPRLIVREST